MSKSQEFLDNFNEADFDDEDMAVLRWRQNNGDLPIPPGGIPRNDPEIMRLEKDTLPRKKNPPKPKAKTAKTRKAD